MAKLIVHLMKCASFCGYIKLHSNGQSKKVELIPCPHFSHQQSESWHWLHGEGSGWASHGKTVPSRGCDMSMRWVLLRPWNQVIQGAWVSSREGLRWVQAPRNSQALSLRWGAGWALVKLRGAPMDLSAPTRTKWSNLTLLSWNIPECASSDFSRLKSNPLKPRYHF